MPGAALENVGLRAPGPSSRTSSTSESPSSAADDLDRPAARARRDAVLDRVLDERLQRERRNHAIERVGVEPLDDAQTVAEAQLLEREIVADESHLVGQRHVLARRAFDVEHVAQHVAEPLERVLGGLRIATNERGERVQRVEQKVRIELAAQRRELGVHAQRIGAGDAGLLFAQPLGDPNRRTSRRR